LGQADILLNLTEQELPEYIAPPMWGTWQYFFGNTRTYDVAGTWEVLQRAPVICSGLEVITERGRRVVYTSYGLSDPSSVRQTMNRCYWKSATFAVRVLRQLCDDPEGFSTRSLPAEKGNGHDRLPGNAAFAATFSRNFAKRVVNKLGRWFLRRDWILMYAENKGGKTLPPLEQYKELHAPEGYFWADPVLVEKEGRHYLFVEEYVYAEQKGRISVMEVNGNNEIAPPQPVLERPYHLSYPFVFVHDGTYYMIPETSDNRTVELYECTSFPHQWAFRRNLLENVCAVDSTVWHHEGRWWLFTCMEAEPGAGMLDELFVFSTEDIINSPLAPHPRNPVVSDVRSARPAGPFFTRSGEWYRPSQVCAPYYGWGLLVNRVNLLNESDYSEQQAAKMVPDSRLKIAGIHTYTQVGGICVIDALKDTKK
ncbi:MAG: hypothetical protein JNL72_12120, partial [Flavipsychrobacter sp.]|nr:hypothetical protein [Flavipsychrobacter sp.]